MKSKYSKSELKAMAQETVAMASVGDFRIAFLVMALMAHTNLPEESIWVKIRDLANMEVDDEEGT